MTEDRGLPTALFGKSEESGDGFGILWMRDDFPEEGRIALVEIAKAFGLKGSKGSECYPPCFALWPTRGGTGWVAARLRDAGQDSLGRPHTLRIEALHVADKDVAIAAGFLDPHTWPSAEWDEIATRTPLPTARDDKLLEAIREGSQGIEMPSVLRAYHNAYTSRFQIRLDRNGDVVARPERTFGKQAPAGAVPPQRRFPWKLLRVFVPFAAGALLTLAWHSFQMKHLRSNSELEKQRVAAEGQLASESEKKEREQLKNELKRTADELQVTKESRKRDSDFFNAAKDYGIGNTRDLRKTLDRAGIPHPKEDIPTRDTRLIEDMKSMLDELKDDKSGGRPGLGQPRLSPRSGPSTEQ